MRDRIRVSRVTATAETDAPPEIEGRWLWVREPGATRAGTVLYAHGGGFVAGDPELIRPTAAHLSAATRRRVLSLDYRLAPEHPYPAAALDVVAAYRAVLASGERPDQILLVGDSAGGTLVLSALLMLLEDAEKLPAGVVALSPVTDLTLSGASFTTNATRDVLPRSGLRQAVDAYLGGADPAAPPQSPAHGTMRGAPPLLLTVGSAEVLVDDVTGFAYAADAAGVDVTLEIYADLTHGFHVPGSPGAAVLMDRIGDWARRMLGD